MGRKLLVKDQDKFIVRLPDGMRDKLKKAADQNSRSMTAEIVARIEASFAENADLVATKQDLIEMQEQLQQAIVARWFEQPE